MLCPLCAWTTCVSDNSCCLGCVFFYPVHMSRKPVLSRSYLLNTDWMLASVSNQTVSTNGQNIDVSKDNTEGRFPGLRPMVISNDKMRDHKMDLLEERAFRRWCCSHIINYNFTEFIEDASEEREISFHVADLFSDEIQANPCPASGSMAWHLPVSDWDGDERFCLRLPS